MATRTGPESTAWQQSPCLQQSGSLAKVLRDAGLVISERRGTNIYYWLAPGFAERFRSIGASLGRLLQVG